MKIHKKYQYRGHDIEIGKDEHNNWKAQTYHPKSKKVQHTAIGQKKYARVLL